MTSAMQQNREPAGGRLLNRTLYCRLRPEIFEAMVTPAMVQRLARRQSQALPAL